MKPDSVIEDKIAFFFGLFCASLFSIGIWAILYVMYKWMF